MSHTNNIRLVAAAAVLLVLAPVVTFAGPPLLCPGTVLTEAELEQLAPLRDKTKSKEQKVDLICALLEKNDSGRYHFEAVRYFFHASHKSLPLLEARLKPEKRGVTLRDYDHALVRVMQHYGDSGIQRDIDRMARVADLRNDPALQLSIAEALDLVGVTQLGSHLTSRVSRAYFEDALAGFTKSDASDPETGMLRRLLNEHVPFLKRMHSRDWDWTPLDKAIAEAGLEVMNRR